MYKIISSSPTQYSVYTVEGNLLVKEGLTLDNAERLIASLISDIEDFYNNYTTNEIINMHFNLLGLLT